MVLIAYSTDLLMLFVSWELMSLPTYALAAFSKRDPISKNEAIKYFMFGALSTGILVLAIGFVYGITKDNYHRGNLSRLWQVWTRPFL